MKNINKYLVMLCIGFVVLTSSACRKLPPRAPGVDELRSEVEQTERAFAATMANRDLAAFASFVDDEAVFFAEGGPLRGKGAIVEGWQGYFETDEAPFSWEPGTVEVLPSGKLALSTGPVYDRGGACVATFTSIWRLADDNMWRVVFDRGSNQCEFAD